MTEPTIVCPKCHVEIRLTESLAAPLLESTRRKYEEELAQKDEQVAEREASILQRENALAKAKASLDEQVAQALRQERPKIAAEEAAKVRLALEADLGAKAQEVADLQEIVKQRDERLLEAQKAQAQLVQDRRRLEDEKRELETTIDERLREEREKIATEAAKKARLALEQDLAERAQEIADLQEVLQKREEKLAEAQKAQAELLRQQRELDAAKRELELTVEKRVQEGLTATREQAKKEAEEELKLKVMEKEQTIASMQKTIEDLRRKAEQGSQQLQGEVQELALEEMLRSKFPDDVIVPVPKGEHGGDVKHEVNGVDARWLGRRRVRIWKGTGADEGEGPCGEVENLRPRARRSMLLRGRGGLAGRAWISAVRHKRSRCNGGRKGTPRRRYALPEAGQDAPIAKASSYRHHLRLLAKG